MSRSKNIIETQRRLLRIEYENEKASYRQTADRIGIIRLVQRGKAWCPVSIGRCYYNSLNQRVVEVTNENTDDPDADHEFEYGRPVSFFTLSDAGASSPMIRLSGTVSYVDGNRMLVAIPENADISLVSGNDHKTGVMLSFDETTYRVMFEALDSLSGSEERLAELRDIVYSGAKTSEFSLGHVSFPFLNGSQEKGVNKVLAAKDVAIVHGPPGTGKTTTLVEAIHETLRRESQVMVCAQSNMAVDWISEKLVDRGISVVRIGNPTRVNDKMLSFTYERLFESHPDYPTLWSIRKAIRELYGERRHSTESRHQKIERLKSRATEIELRINNEIFSSAKVVACTLVGSASRLLYGMKFATVFIDEAAQALQAACWIPMRRCSRMVLAGDHCQLPPTVKSPEAARGGLARSLMEVIVSGHPECVTRLTTQYRMNRAIMQFSSDVFYDGELKAAKEVTDRGILDYDTPMEWIDTSCLQITDSSEDDVAADFHEAIAGESFGRINKAEGRLTIKILKDYLDKIGKGRVLEERISIGVISPYRAQMRYLRHLMKSAGWTKPFRHLISINTVDGFQGQERDVIIISLVRNNERGQIGFLRDLRRMNVAMTRARMKLILVGDSPTLSKAHPFYRYLLSYIGSL